MKKIQNQLQTLKNTLLIKQKHNHAIPLMHWDLNENSFNKFAPYLENI
ncbi:hypothetical protein EDC55_1276 [Allofrancisella inopinata]|nr:hypothetical protein EDC55_1276 [Allofrancisella inopinata]